MQLALFKFKKQNAVGFSMWSLRKAEGKGRRGRSEKRGVYSLIETTALSLQEMNKAVKERLFGRLLICRVTVSRKQPDSTSY